LGSDPAAVSGGDLLASLLDAELRHRRDAHLFRHRRPLAVVGPVHVEIAGRRFVNFASNNYLGLTHHPRVIDAVADAVRRHGAGAGASALITGYSADHAAAEEALARWKGTGSAILLPSGYQAAHAIVQTFAQLGEAHPGGVRFLLDKLTHASLIDAVRGAGAPFRVFPHNHLGKLERLLAESAGALDVVITESIFSMDGDAADLAGLADLKRRRPFCLVLDEAHGSGVYGVNGGGYANERNLQSAVDVSLITLSKALGLAGGAACASRAFCEALVNLGRAYIFSTAVPPGAAAGVCAALDVLRAEPERQARVRAVATRFRAALGLAGDAPIIPVILGTAEAALASAARLEEAGFLVVAVRPPTVAPGTSRLRITLSAEHTDADVDALARAVIALRSAANPTAANLPVA